MPLPPCRAGAALPSTPGRGRWAVAAWQFPGRPAVRREKAVPPDGGHQLAGTVGERDFGAVSGARRNAAEVLTRMIAAVTRFLAPGNGRQLSVRPSCLSTEPLGIQEESGAPEEISNP